jgi:hypothetical protein
MIQDYDLHLEKREIQKRLLSMVKTKRVVTLAGPNLLTYAKMYSSRIKYFEIWEKDREVMLRQLAVLRKLGGRRIIYHFGDIINADINKSAFYDLDFCSYMPSATTHLARFKDCPFMLTTCLRNCSIERTLELFLDTIGEQVLSDVHHPNYNLMKTNKNTYLYITYTDKSSMMTIFKFH